MSLNQFDYDTAFDRNIGWLTKAEQLTLKKSCVAIAGLGGAGGFQAQALARLGVQNFRIADPDTFELTNLNRQIGAGQKTIGKSKVAVVRAMILDINPDAQIEVFTDGIHKDNIHEFLKGCDLVLDGVDFYALEAKILLFETAQSLKLTTLTSCPLGFGASLLFFTPESMSFQKYFDLKPEMTDAQKRFALAFGLSPNPLCLQYMQPEAAKIDSGRAASVAPGLMLVGAISGTEAVKFLTKKASIKAVPTVTQIDLFTQKIVQKKYPAGMSHFWLRFKKWLVLNFFLPKDKKNAKHGLGSGAQLQKINLLIPAVCTFKDFIG